MGHIENMSYNKHDKCNRSFIFDKHVKITYKHVFSSPSLDCRELTLGIRADIRDIIGRIFFGLVWVFTDHLWIICIVHSFNAINAR